MTGTSSAFLPGSEVARIHFPVPVGPLARLVAALEACYGKGLVLDASESGWWIVRTPGGG